MSGAARFAGATGGVAVAVGVLGSVMGAGAGVWWGAAVGFGFQSLLFWLLFVRAFPGRALQAHALAMLGRLALVGGAALLWVPRSGLPGAPLLLGMVTVLFVSTLLEPVFLDAEVNSMRAE